MENKRPLKTIYTCFPGGKHKVLTMSYDDGREFDRRLISIFNKYGIKGTFHLNSGLMDVDETRIQLNEVKELYKGHEVSCHTLTHPTIERCPLSQVVQQVIEDRKRLEDACGYPVRGLSYPNGSYSKDIINLLPACGIEYSRVVGSTDDFKFPDNFLEWKSTCHHNHNLMENAQRFADLHKTQYLYMMYVWGHSYEFDYNEGGNSFEAIEEFCKFIGGRDDIWYATNIEIVDYMNAAKNLKFTAKGDKVYNPNACSVWLEVDRRHIEVRGGETVEL
ncbi:MAG: polysaccharide deacetylase family protein [Clostridia bacterium]|nr:polysaccharide deacetylase family protein [Clostridia bacterium]